MRIAIVNFDTSKQLFLEILFGEKGDSDTKYGLFDNFSLHFAVFFHFSLFYF